jgi:hypothetical protein
MIDIKSIDIKEKRKLNNKRIIIIIIEMSFILTINIQKFLLKTLIFTFFRSFYSIYDN